MACLFICGYKLVKYDAHSSYQSYLNFKEFSPLSVTEERQQVDLEII